MIRRHGKRGSRKRISMQSITSMSLLNRDGVFHSWVDLGEQQDSRSNQKQIENVAFGSGITAGEPFADVQGSIKKVAFYLRPVGGVEEGLSPIEGHVTADGKPQATGAAQGQAEGRDSRAIFVMAVQGSPWTSKCVSPNNAEVRTAADQNPMPRVSVNSR
jgi:hypothetical protein